MCWYDGKLRVNKTMFRRFLKSGRDANEVTESGRLFHARAAATETARSPIVERAVAGTISAAVVALTWPPPPGEGHQQGTVVQVNSDSSTPKPPVKTWFVPGLTTSEGRAATASRGQIYWTCRSDASQRSKLTEVYLADMKESWPASHYHSPAVKQFRWTLHAWTFRWLKTCTVSFQVAYLKKFCSSGMSTWTFQANISKSDWGCLKQLFNNSFCAMAASICMSAILLKKALHDLSWCEFVLHTFSPRRARPTLLGGGGERSPQSGGRAPPPTVLAVDRYSMRCSRRQ